MQREHLLTVESSPTIHPLNKDVFLSPWYIGVGDGLVFSPEMESLLLPEEVFLPKGEVYHLKQNMCNKQAA